MNKTLIGKDGFLFLQNDSANELEVHNDNLCKVNNFFYKKYENIIDKFLLIIFPNKSYVCKKYLPDKYNLQYRPGFDTYKKYLKNNILDGYNYANQEDTFYKTDTHMNLKGCVNIYNAFVNKVNKIFNLNIVSKKINLAVKEVSSLLELQLGIGDLIWPNNLGDQELKSKNDTYFFSNDLELLYCKYIITQDSEIKILLFNENKLEDQTSSFDKQILTWDIVSKYVLYKKNNNSENKKKILVFYDSFLLSTMSLYLNMFSEVYMFKSVFDSNLVNFINPDYIFEFRVERFLF
jgi:hypothetical protein